jgi:heme-degrading monooxygenase HmoA
MTTLGTYPPNEQEIAAMAAIPGARFTEGAVSALDGPEAHLGPEAAGCVMVLHATFTSADPEGAERFWAISSTLTAEVAEAPGLIRLIGFEDGLSVYGIGWWVTEEDARAFARGASHREAVREQRRNPFQYTQFAGLWGPMTYGHRDVYCDQCGKSTRLPADACKACGNEVVDVFRLQAQERSG